MKTSVLIAVVVSLVAVSCGEKSNPSAQATNAATGDNPLTAPVDYLGEAAKARHSAVKTVDVTSVNKAIEMFNVDKGRNPKDLNELVAEKYLPKIPDTPFGTKLEYDANAGKVTVVKQ